MSLGWWMRWLADRSLIARSSASVSAIKIVPKGRQKRSHLVVRHLHEDVCVD